ncbi:LAGLIDADG family homing endonuclease [Candidatus Woesearchaeota archaeon]|nr:LAGLIDADG family homing endonuclease [Candidatus Woesearchaeota archaeon]
MLDKNYILGLVDGEGSFNVQIIRKNRTRPKVDLRFCLKLRHQDKEMLEALQQFFGCGSVYIQRDKRVNHTLCYRYEVHTREEIINRIIPFFEENQPQIQSRKRDFELFKQIALLTIKEPVDLAEIERLKEQMHWGLAAYGKTVRAVGTPSNPE